MKHIIEIETLLEFYDIPQLFIGKDKADTRFICICYDDVGMYKYLAIKASFNKLNQFMAGEIDLRTLLLTPELTNEYFTVTFQHDEYEISPLHGDIEENMLPAEGYFYSGDWAEYMMMRKPHKRNSRRNPIAAIF